MLFRWCWANNSKEGRRNGASSNTRVLVVFVCGLQPANITLGTSSEKKTGLSGNFSHTRGGGSDPFPLVYVCLPSFFLACQNHPEVLKNIFYYFEIFLFWDIFRKKTAFRRKNSHTGGGGGVFPRGNFSHIIPFLVLKTSLT